MVQVVVRYNDVGNAFKLLKRQLQHEGIFRVMKMKRHFEKPCEAKARKAAEAFRRRRKLDRRRFGE